MTIPHDDTENRIGTAVSADLPDFDGLAAVIGEPDPAADPVAGRPADIAPPAAEPAETSDAPGDPDPDIGFSMTAPVIDIPQRARNLAHRIAQDLFELGPQGWVRLHASFALTATGQRSRVVFSDGGDREAQRVPSPETLARVAEHRQLSAELGDGPWWRLELELTAAGELSVDHDYGDEPFPADQLFGPQDYLADLDAYPRDELPTWLAAYLRHDDRQSRSPQQAAAAARAERESGYLPVVSEDDFPDFPVLWARWAAISAAFVAVGSEWGPRVLPSFAWFEGSRRSGSSLYLLPGGRAVLSGGVWGAPELAAAYNGKAPLPRLYAGAPEWVANQVLNTRAGGGMLTFCYWWERGRWYRGESPSATELAPAVPGIWTSGTVTDVVTRLISDQPTAEQRSAVAEFVAAAERRDVTHAVLAAAFEDRGDLDAAHYQLALAGVARIGPDPLPAAEALDAVRHQIRSAGTESASYPLDSLRAERLSVGWLVYVPTDPEEVVIDRALFYVADDGVVEQATSSTPASVYLPGFEQRFHQRHSQ
ncbi:hypothetical protein ACIRRA_00420 [Nocardia sp. NPDC101769]|uniref:hypothetical protein n=1 Tax=Nocardia sp. NPDC101769 TaxID=3364333 RepID=UPI003824D73B